MSEHRCVLAVARAGPDDACGGDVLGMHDGWIPSMSHFFLIYPAML